MAKTQTSLDVNWADPYKASLWKPMLAFILFILAIAVAGNFSFNRYRESIKRDRQNELAGVAGLKIMQLKNWMSERRGDVQILKDDPLFLAEVGHWLQRGSPAGEIKERLIRRLDLMKNAYADIGFTSIYLLDGKGVPHLSSSTNEVSMSGREKELALDSMRTGQILFSDIHQDVHSGSREPDIDIDIAAPLFAGKGKQAKAIGVVFFRIDPRRFLFPLIQHWPVPSASAETLLVRREGDEIVFLNELHHRKNTALTLRLPLSQHQLPAVLAAQGREGLVEGVDYRGVPIVGVMSKVPGTAWFMVSKIDQEEIYEPINKLANWMVALMLILTGALLFSILAAIYMARKIAEPAINLTKVARAITQGDYSVRADIKGRNEIAELAVAFNAMAQQLTTVNAQLEQKIIEREQFFKFFDLSPDPMCIASQDGFVKKTNSAFARVIENSENELLARPLIGFITPEGRQPALDEINKQLCGGVTINLEKRYLCKDGSICWLSWVAFMNRDDGFIYATARDITERKAMENALERSEARARMAIMASHSALWDYDVTTGSVYLSDGWSMLLGGEQKPTFTTIHGLTDLVPEEERQMVRDAIVKAMKGHNSSEYHVTHRVKKIDGSFIWVHSEGMVIKRDQDSRALRMIGINRDITELKEAEKQLRHQKNFMWQILDTDPSLVFVRDRAGKFILANQALADYYGLTIQEIIGKNICEISSGHEDPLARNEVDSEIMESRSEMILSVSSSLPDGKQHWYHTIRKPLVLDDGTVNVLCIAVDITEHKLSEMRLAESYLELQRLSVHLESIREDERAKVARDLHDEMGSLLVALKMRVTWLASKIPPGLPRLADEAGHISGLVKEAISTVRDIATQLRPNLQEGFGFEGVVEDYVEKFRQQTGIKCNLVFPEGELAAGASQSITLFRILQESLSNVAKYAQASQVEIRFTKQGESLSMVIEDNGVGFDQAALKIGTLGLIGIRERALMVGGKARISSTPGKGTRISAIIPLFE